MSINPFSQDDPFSQRASESLAAGGFQGPAK